MKKVNERTYACLQITSGSAAKPSSNTAMVVLCTTLSVRHMGAIGLDTSALLNNARAPTSTNSWLPGLTP